MNEMTNRKFDTGCIYN